MIKRMDKSEISPASTNQSALQITDRIRTIIEHLDEIAISINDIPQIDALARHYLNQLRHMLFSIAAASSVGQPSPPSRAPAKWLERRKKKETPIEFIRREYAPWLATGSLSRPLIRKLDRSLYAALCNWVSINGSLPSDMDLPTKKEINDRRLKEITSVSLKLSPEARERRRLYQLARRRLRPDSQPR